MEDDVDTALRLHGAALADAIEEALPRWIARCIGDVADPADATQRAIDDVVPRLRALLAQDVDEQRQNPLHLLREATRHPTETLQHAGVAPPHRDRFGEEHFPGDVYGLAPMTWRDVDESLHEPGLVWGALKARASITRHRQAGDT
ncbi:MAG TPA: hypothetical protein VEA78_13875 [Acidimicrobiales bacterium]|nr:hypothetical protein [Acidimicrobiales bacterium]